MYSTLEDMRSILPKGISIGSSAIGTPSPGQPVLGRDNITFKESIFFRQSAESEINSRLMPYYIVPLRRVKLFETDTLNNLFNGTDVIVKVNDSGSFSIGQLVRIQDKMKMETTEVIDIPDLNSIKIKKINNDYEIYESKISILSYPPPIPLTEARLAVSYGFDVLFTAEQSPNISEYGKSMRELALNSLDSILSGTVLLMGQDHTGKRFARGSLFDAFQNPTPEFQFGREK